MPANANASLKQRIRQGETVIGVSAPLDVTRSQLETILSKDSYDFVFTDSQHSPFNEERLVRFCALTQALDIPVQFRIKHTRHAYLIGNILDLGPLGIEVPQVELESTVDEAIDAFYYPQAGKRSWGGAARYGFQEREDRLSYADWWNNQASCVCRWSPLMPSPMPENWPRPAWIALLGDRPT